MEKLQHVYAQVMTRVDLVLAEREGQGLVEYALILLLIALAVAVFLPPVAAALNQAFSRVTAAL